MASPSSRPAPSASTSAWTNDRPRTRRVRMAPSGPPKWMKMQPLLAESANADSGLPGAIFEGVPMPCGPPMAMKVTPRHPIAWNRERRESGWPRWATKVDENSTPYPLQPRTKRAGRRGDFRLSGFPCVTFNGAGCPPCIVTGSTCSPHTRRTGSASPPRACMPPASIPPPRTRKPAAAGSTSASGSSSASPRPPGIHTPDR